MKKKHLLIIATWLMLLTVSMSMLTFVGCGDDEKVLHVDTEIVGTYYVDDGDVENTLTLNVDSFTMVFGGETQTGVYSSFDNSSVNNVKVGLKTKAGTTCELAYSRGVVVLNYNGNSYRMLKKVDYTVTFDTDGGSSVVAQTVQNGRKATKPATDPQKAGYVFLGWYKDAAYTQKYDFENTAVVSSITLYARFVELNPNAKTYTVNFDLGAYEGEVPSMQTINQKLYNLPEPQVSGAEFVGWWLSDYNDANKLSRKYKEQTINDNVTLYAVWASEYPAVSVDENGAEWTVKGEAKRFTVTIKDSTGTALKTETGEKTSYAFNFGNVDEGDYTVEVTCNGKTTVAYYLNKPLNRVNAFTVEGNVLKFEGVEGAEKYLLTLVCGNATHEHNDIDLGTTTQYDFSACEMKDGKLTFVVKAVAEGRATSVSDEYVLNRTLDAVEGLTVDAETETVKWNAVANAEGYYVELTNGQTKLEKTLTETQFTIGEYADGTWTIKVKATNKLYNSPDYTTYEYSKVRLASPTQISARLNVLTWNAIEGATGYKVEIDGQEYTTETNSLTLDEDVYNKGSFTVKVKALGATEAQNSLYSNPLNVLGELTEVKYANGLATWSPVIGATKYGVSVDGGTETYVEDGKCELEYTFNAAGTHTLKVAAYDRNGALLDDMPVELELYAVVFNTNGGTKVDTLYKVKDDTFELPADPTRTGYDFVGWYDKSSGGNKYDGTITVGESGFTIFAAWNGKKYQVTLVVGDGGTMEDDNVITVTYGEEFQFPVAKCNDVKKAFGGWFTAATKGISYTDNGGNSRFAWNLAKDTTLYAQWETTGLVYTLNTDGESYLVTKGEGINFLTSVEILATYNGKPVTHILSGAFEGCTTLEKIRIPSSIQSIFIYADDKEDASPNVKGSTFYNCNNLKEIEVYDVAGEKFYTSVDGCLYTVKNGQLDALAYVPRGLNITGTFEIPDGTKSIPSYAMSSMTNLTEIIIPSSVTYVGASAFSSCYSLKTVRFLPTADGTLGEPLTVKAAFKYAHVLETVILPKRLVEIDLDAFYVFDGYETLKTITVEELGTTKDTSLNYYDLNGMLCKGDTLLYCPKGYTGEFRVPVGITKIGDEAFKKCIGLTFISIPGYVTSIGESAFEGCNKVQRLLFDQGEDNVDLRIEKKAFYGLELIEELILPPALVYLGENAFGNTPALTSVTLNMAREFEFKNDTFKATGSSGQSYVSSLAIGVNVRDFNIISAFGTGLSKINVNPDNEYFLSEDDVLYDKQQTKILFIPENVVEYTIPSTIKEIGANMFEGKPFTSITIGKGVEVIGESAFEGCEELTSIIFEQGGEKKITIGKNAFKGCKNVTTLVLPERAEKGSVIGEGAFAASTVINSGIKVAEITVPEGFTVVGRFAFRGTISLVTLNLPSSIETLGIYEDGDRYNNSTYDSKMVLKNPGVNIVNGCNYIEAINVAEGCANYASKDGVLYGKDAKTGELTSLQVVPRQIKGVQTEEREGGYLEVPETVNTVCDYAFYYVTTLEEIVFLGEHENFELGNNAFYFCATVTKPYTGLKKVQLPSGIDKLPKAVFQYCSVLEEVTVPNTVTTIEVNAFSGCSALKKIIFAEGGDKELIIGDGGTSGYGSSMSYTGVFRGCNALEEVVFTDRLTYLGQYAFYECAALTKVTLPTSVKTIANNAFKECKVLSSVTFTDAGEKAATEMTIGENAFDGCENLTSITLPDNLVEIQQYAFNKTDLRELSIPANVKTLADLTLNNAGSFANLTSVTFKTKNVDGVELSALTTLASGVFKDYKLIESIDLSATQITEISSELFSGCISLKSVKLPMTVTTISASAFNGCTALTEFTFPKDIDDRSNVVKIGNMAFANSGLTKFEFPETNGELSLGTKLFNGCENLTYLYISNSVNPDELGTAVVGAPAIETFETAPGSTLSFDATNKLMLSVIDAEAQNKTYKIIKAYDKVPTVNGTFTIPSNVVEIGDNVFSNMNYIKTVIIPYSVQAIGKEAFKNCVALENVIFESTIDNPSTLFEIGESAFYGTFSLKEITIPETVKAIGNTAFSLSGIRKVTMPNELTQAGKKVFQSCYWLEEANNVSKITPSANYTAELTFDSCTSLKNVTFANGFDTLMRGMFYNTGIESVDLVGVTKYSTYGSDTYGIFQLCTSLKSVVIDENLKKLDYKMFTGCTNLDTVTISGNTAVEGFADFSNITTINKEGSTVYAPLLSTAFRTVDISSLTSNTGYFFYGAEKLEKVIVSAGLTKLGNAMFKNCTNLKTITYPIVNGYAGEDGCVTLPENVNFMGYVLKTGTFEASGIEKVIIPKSTKMLGNSASAASASTGVNLFKDCTSLTTVTLHKDMTKFSASIFEGCINLTTVNYRDENDNIVGEDNAVTLPKGITQFGQSMFKGCTSITSLTTESKAKLDNSMFENCTSLTTASFAATQFGNKVFAGCTNLQSTEENPLTTSQLTSVGSQVFENCASIEYIDISNASSIGTTGGSTSGFFYGCTNLKKVLLKSTLTTIPKGMFGYCTSLEEITLPSSLNFINQYAFYNSGLRSITIPSKVTRLGATTSATGSVTATNSGYVFAGCENLETVTLHNAFLYIGGYVFDGCTNLKEVKNADKVMLIAQYAFRNAGLTEEGLTMDLSGVQTIGKYAFDNSGLKEANLASLKNGTSYLYNYAFNNAEKLTKVTLNENVVDITNYAFYGCSALSDINLGAATTIGKMSFAYCTSLNNLDLSAVKTVGESAFIGCSTLDTVTFGELETISFQAFLNCGFTTFTIPATLTKLGQNVFNSGYKIAVETGSETFKFDDNGYLLNKDNEVVWIPSKDADGNAVTEITFADGYKLTGYVLNGYASVTKVTLPSDLKTIPEDAFWNFKGSFGEDFTIPAKVETIESYAFQKATGLKNLTIPKTVKTIGNYAFSESSVENVTFEQGLTTTGTYTFYKCQNLTTVTLPGSLTTIGDSAFRSCKALNRVIVSVTAEEVTSTGLTIGKYAFYETGLEGELSIPYGVTEIGDYAFTYTKLTKVSLPNTLTEIGDYAFAYMDNLTEINVPYTVDTIGNQAFVLDSNLTTVTFDDTPKGVEEKTLSITAGGASSSSTSTSYAYLVEELNSKVGGLFTGDFALKTVKLPTRLTTIPSYMFAYSGLESITLHDGITTIGNGAFMHTGITEITIPYTVTTINNHAFALCEKLTTVNFADAPAGTDPVQLEIKGSSSSGTSLNINYYAYCAATNKYYSGAFAGCMAIESFTLPARLKEIPSYMFVGMNVKTVIISDGFKDLGDYAFQYCTQMEELVIPTSVTVFGSSTFLGWTKDQTIKILVEEDASLTLSSNFFKENEAKLVIEVV